MASDGITVVTQSVVNVFVSSTVNTFETERRFQKDLNIEALKGKLELLTGASQSTMTLELYSKDSRLVCQMDNTSAMLGSYPIGDGMRIHVIDTSSKAGEFEDVSKVEKFEISKEEYEKKTDSVRAFKEKNKLGRFAKKDPEEDKQKEEERIKKENEEKEMCDKMNVGDRCQVTAPGNMPRLGTLRFKGLVDFKPGYWVGVQYDEPLGKNDGSVKGKRYFECPDKYGGFVKPGHVTTGDYPEEDLFDEGEM